MIIIDDDGDNDAEIVGIAKIPTPAEALAHPDFPAFYATWKLDRDERWHGIGEDQAADHFRVAVRDNNRKLRQRFHNIKAIERTLLKRHDRHAPLVLSPAFNVNHPAVVALTKYEADPTRPLAVLSGPPGTGKTTAAVWWTMHHANGVHGKLPGWTTASAFARTSRYDDARGKLLAEHALVLDDAGSEYSDAKGSLRTDIDELVNVYYGANRRLVLTTNLDAKGFAERYGERVADRIAEAGVWIPVIGESLRRKAT